MSGAHSPGHVHQMACRRAHNALRDARATHWRTAGLPADERALTRIMLASGPALRNIGTAGCLPVVFPYDERADPGLRIPDAMSPRLRHRTSDRRAHPTRRWQIAR